MPELNNTDRQLVTYLRQDARASVTTLAGQLGVSRATVQARLSRLVESGAIQRFTVDLDPAINDQVVRAVMLIEVEGPMARAVTQALYRMPELTSLHTTNGNWDLVAHIETLDLEAFDRVLRKVREIRGVLNSETNILLSSAR